MHLKDQLEACIDREITRIIAVVGGDINEAYEIHTSSQEVLFAKINRTSNGMSILESEYKGLKLLQQAGKLKVPKPFQLDKISYGAVLILEYIQAGNKSGIGQADLGRHLAGLHKKSHSSYGLSESNYIGSLIQHNTYTDTWIDFYADQRIEPQIRKAVDNGFISNQIIAQLPVFFTNAADEFPMENPSLIHGDLWSGNYIITDNGTAVFIDPSVAYSHREMDLAMSKLFGGFSESFYRSYQESFPVEKGFNYRLELYQLYYLLVHVNLFGSAYVPPVVRILRKYT